MLVVSSLAVNAQKWLKSLQEAVEDQVSNESESSTNTLDLTKSFRDDQLEKDTSNYNYIFSQGNRASFFANRESKESILLTGAKYYEDESIKSDLQLYEEVFDLNRAGEAVIYINQKSAFSSFFEALQKITANNAITVSLLDSAFDVSDLVGVDTLSGPEKYALGKTLANISILIHAEGKYSLSDDFIEMTTDYFNTYIGKGSIALASLYNNHAVIAQSQGKFTSSEDYFNLAEAVIAANDREGTLSHAIILSNKALLKNEVGQYEEASRFIHAAISMAEGEIRKKGRDNVSFQINQGLILFSAGEYERAEQVFREILTLKENRMAKNQTDYANVETYLAGTLMAADKPAEVEGLLQDALRIFEKKYNKDHPAYIKSNHSLGKYYLSRGRYTEAEIILTSVKESYKSNFGTNHPDYLSSLEDLAVVAWKTKEDAMAESRFKEAIDLRLDLVEKYFGAMSEYEKGQYWSMVRPSIIKFYNYAVEKKNPELLTRMYDIHLKTKGILMSASTKVREEILNSDDEDLKRIYSNWVKAKEDLILHYSYSREQLKELNINLEEEEAKANSLEKQLNRLSTSFANANKLPTATFSNVKNALGNGEAAIELIGFRKFENSFTPDKYYVSLIAKSTSANPGLVLFENGNEMDGDLVNLYSKKVLFKLPDISTYGIFWQPIEEQLSGISTVYLSIDGVYNQINVSALQKPDKTFVADALDIQYYASTRDLLQTNQLSTSKTASFVGNPNFGDDNLTLPGTEVEINAVSAIAVSKSFDVNKLMGEEATEDNVKRISNPAVLHIATHGFFLPEQEASDEKIFGIDVDQANKNPLLRSGLMLTGASRALEQTNPSEINVKNNGILTAYEALTLDLKDTDLVVLSACETGLGAIKSGEGVYGLQRSFQIAGAEAVIMSLWKVSDEATKSLMINFYNEWMGGKSKEKAFAMAQKKLRESFPEPYYWGAFVMLN